MKIFLLFALHFIFLQQLNAQISIFKTAGVTSINNKKIDSKYLHKQYTIVTFFATACPLSQNYTLILNNLYHKYKNEINFFCAFPGIDNKRKDLLAFKKKYMIPYPMIQDKGLNLTNILNATVTPEVFLLDSTGAIQYHGAIDNWVSKLGKTRKLKTISYLENAIIDVLQSKKPATGYINPIGCFIEK